MQAFLLLRRQGKDTTLQVARTTLIPSLQAMDTLEGKKQQKPRLCPVHLVGLSPEAQKHKYMNHNMIPHNRLLDKS